MTENKNVETILKNGDKVCLECLIYTDPRAFQVRFMMSG